jgi:hypothetical protein
LLEKVSIIFKNRNNVSEVLSSSQNLFCDATYHAGGTYKSDNITTSMGIVVGTEQREFKMNVEIGENLKLYIGFEYENLPSKKSSKGSIEVLWKY